ncbi:hypothetical protein C7405_103334 [Paraburkholderia caballeronis]|nr:hypothetical protein C7405_103334 [Paraburkholderia caballeronis]
MSLCVIVRSVRARVVRASVVVATAAVFVAGCGSAPPRATSASIGVAAQPNGIAVRPGDGALFITDDRDNAVLWSSDHATFARYATVPAVPGQPNALSQPAFARQDTLLVARFGFGSAGALVSVSASGDASVLTGLVPQRRRLGLVSLGPGRALSSWFVKSGSQPNAGGVSVVTYDDDTHAATERDLIAGLSKPVGIAVGGDTLFVSDQARGVILRYGLPALLAARSPASAGVAFARVDGPDLLAVDHAGALYTKCGDHGLCRIAPDGAVTTLADDFSDARGVAVDDARHTLYAVDRVKGAGATSAIRVFPLSEGTSASH